VKPENSVIGQICIQVYPTRAPELDVASLKVACEVLARAITGVRGIGFSEGDDGGTYLNIVFAAEEPAATWRRMRPQLLESSVFATNLLASCMVVCTGLDGWNDYLLLYHYDPTVAIDASEA
jgi:hypothetical protein